MQKTNPLQTRRDYAQQPVREATVAPGRGDRLFLITELDGSDRVAIYRTSHPDGFLAKPCDETGAESGSETTIYATAKTVCSVYRTDDVVWCRRIGGRTHVVGIGGRTKWTGVALEDIAPGDSGDVTLNGTGTVTVSGFNWSANQYIATDDELQIWWEDEEQRFILDRTKCSEIV